MDREEKKQKLIQYYLIMMGDFDDPEDVRQKQAEDWAEIFLKIEGTGGSNILYSKDWTGCP